MRAIIKTAPEPGASFVSDFPEPEPKEDEVLIEVHAASVCGSDREFYRWGSAAKSFPMQFPRVLGHEGSGVILEVGAAVTSLKAGDRVAIDSHAPCGSCFQCRIGNGHNCDHMRLLGNDLNGVFAERTALPSSMVTRIPDDMPFEIGALLEPAGVAWHAMQRANKQIGANIVLISGCGPIGLLAIEYAKILGAAEVIAIEPNSFRRNLASDRGATTFAPGNDVLEYIQSKYSYRGGVDIVFEVSGASQAYPTLLKALRKGGRLVTIGHPNSPITLDVPRLINKREITVQGIFGRLLWNTWEDLMALIQGGRIDLGSLITDRLPLGELGPVIDMLSGNSNKVVMYPQGLA
ncbi:alcohol dehydrogenase catalytic domain-containing protein [Actinomyces urogenitalis]|jgi:threonine 3-dehydrogenase|uniref:alcohol dehydrogenase catalytic domain-containing protein n=1 Tax=Actinomyces urogenitalis TaxID=103621 RepID=UPI00054DD563|nr:alcohol dehydrogenase catalytic domain-containing protein [Actinomyces urogenitalis]MBS6071336.1 alcohol dehydrogenase catalytic domain-containing protein [Actinomyces urogenitalis]MDK8237970.1 alcohol dehydrogenase catalytic domain-containing protein [Actinomyces urogenitalis]MDU0865079.1 alcohol dehydrogenase catalytic domain-containing protein [Actinomyces urogenitalis]MDU0875531.1 alcohol dehydrogenase catalytic domain-containing protein [Actinomyces urogenitalis]MDU1564100.1 alcohol de